MPLIMTTGLVPVTMTQKYREYNPGERAGFTPKLSDALVAAGAATYLEEVDFTPEEVAELKKQQLWPESKQVEVTPEGLANREAALAAALPVSEETHKKELEAQLGLPSTDKEDSTSKPKRAKRGKK